MRFSPSSTPSRRNPKSQRAFSLVEVVLAIGVVSFAFVAILGLLPAGMTQFRKAIDTSVGADIAQRVLDDVQQSDWDVLVNANWPAYRYFDERGVEIYPQSTNAASNASQLTQTEQNKIVYQVATRVLTLPYRPEGVQVAANSLAQVTVQVMNNPSFASPKTDNSNPPLILPGPGYSLLTYSISIAPQTFSTNSNL